MNNSDFKKIVREQEAVFFKRLLPAYIELYFTGKGYLFVRKLLADLDSDKILDILNMPEPSPASVKKSENIKKICPIRVCAEVQFGPNEESVVLGHFSHIERYTASALGPSMPFIENPAAEYRTVYEKKYITIYEGSFISCGFKPREKLEYQVLKTIVHEYIHFFETFFLRSEQMLTSREEPPQGLMVREYTIEEAARLDRIHNFKICAGYAFILFLTVLMLYFLFK